MCYANNLINSIIIQDIAPRELSARRENTIRSRRPGIVTVNAYQRQPGRSQYPSSPDQLARSSGRHQTRDCRKLAKVLKDHHISFNHNTNPPMAHSVSANSSPVSQAWMVDSGASHHLNSCPWT
ncbi:hypothetical protein E3N88_12333 [Mikania micrantha]|uniref:Uncharacterized protein n=1 Tax=Mikania micrantha TaxID=192012 RepID=A0A5N6P579_9ASTR|nr:hypothetical protein E3N88_12333 [Mikania micrantha]